MAAPPVTLPGVYEMIVEFSNVADPTIRWRNTFAFASTPTPAPGDAITSAIYNFCKGMIHDDAQISKFSVYNWARGPQPYPTGSPLFTGTVADLGTAATIWGSALGPTYTPPGGEVVARIDHLPVSGSKPGRNFFRGLFGTENVAALSAGRWFLLIAIAVLQTILDNLLSSAHSNLVAFQGAGSGGQRLVVVRYSPKTGVVHGTSNIASMKLIGVTTNKRTRKNPH